MDARFSDPFLHPFLHPCCTVLFFCCCFNEHHTLRFRRLLNNLSIALLDNGREEKWWWWWWWRWRWWKLRRRLRRLPVLCSLLTTIRFNENLFASLTLLACLFYSPDAFFAFLIDTFFPLLFISRPFKRFSSLLLPLYIRSHVMNRV